MDEIKILGLSNFKIKAMSSYKLSLNIIYISDITHPDGNCIIQDFLKGKTSAFPKSKLSWHN